MPELPIIVIKMSFTRIGRFRMESLIVLGCFADLASLFQWLVLVADRRIPVCRPRVFSSRDTILRREVDIGRFDRPRFDQDGHELPPRATREKPGKCIRADPAVAPGDALNAATSRNWPSIATSRAPGRTGQAPGEKPLAPSSDDRQRGRPKNERLDLFAFIYQCTPERANRPVTGPGFESE